MATGWRKQRGTCLSGRLALSWLQVCYIVPTGLLALTCCLTAISCLPIVQDTRSLFPLFPGRSSCHLFAEAPGVASSFPAHTGASSPPFLLTSSLPFPLPCGPAARLPPAAAGAGDAVPRGA